MEQKASRQYTLKLLLLYAILLVPLGIGMKIYNGPASALISDRLAGSVYVVFWIFVVRMFTLRLPALHVSILVLIITCLLEVTQLYQWPFLEWLRQSMPGRALVGSTFHLVDFPFYLFGALIGYVVLIRIGRKVEEEEHE